jgi:hypothetical protein
MRNQDTGTMIEISGIDEILLSLNHHCDSIANAGSGASNDPIHEDRRRLQQRRFEL